MELSPATYQQICEVYRLAYVENRADVAAVALGEVAQSGEPLAIAWIAPLALDPRRGLAEVTGDVVAQLRRDIPAHTLAALERAVRDQPPIHDAIARWRRIGRDDVAKLAMLRSGRALVQAAMMHPSGYVRAEAIQWVPRVPDGGELELLLLRARDWVEPVRARAQAVLRERVTVHHAVDLVTALPIIDAMSSWVRAAGSSALGHIEQILRSLDSAAALAAGLRAPDRMVRRAVVRRLLAHPVPPRHEMIEAALRDPDLVIRVSVGQWLIGRDEFPRYAEALLRSRVAAIRLRAAHRMRAAGMALPWQALLLDSHAGVRAIAQDAALDAGVEPDAEYRARIPDAAGARRAHALLGLGETGGPDDAAQIRGSLHDERPAVRRAALLALAALKVDDLDAVVLAALRDPSRAVIEAARQRSVSAHPDDLWAVLRDAPTLDGKLAALSLIARLSLWTSLAALLRAHTLGDAAIRERAQRYLERWIARKVNRFVAPSEPDALRFAIRRAELPARLQAQLLGALD